MSSDELEVEVFAGEQVPVGQPTFVWVRVTGVVAYLSWSLLGASRARILFVLLSVNVVGGGGHPAAAGDGHLAAGGGHLAAVVGDHFKRRTIFFGKCQRSSMLRENGGR